MRDQRNGERRRERKRAREEEKEVSNDVQNKSNPILTFFSIVATSGALTPRLLQAFTQRLIFPLHFEASIRHRHDVV